MITPNDRQHFLTLLHELNIPNDYPSLICLYKLLSRVVSRYGNDATKILTEVIIEKFRYVQGFDWTLPSASIIAAKLWSSKTLDLCRIMHCHDLHNDYARFFAIFAPEMVANWYALRQLDTKELPILDVLFWHFTLTAEINNSEAVFDHCAGDFYNHMHQQLPLLQPDVYELIWDAVTYHECAEPDMHSNRVTKAVNLYAAQGKSKQDLLEAYLLEQRDLGKTPICYADLSKQELQKVAIEKIPGDDDVNFYTAPRYVNMEWPDKALANLYDYSKEIPLGESVVALSAPHVWG